MCVSLPWAGIINATEPRPVFRGVRGSDLEKKSRRSMHSLGSEEQILQPGNTYQWLGFPSRGSVAETKAGGTSLTLLMDRIELPIQPLGPRA